MWASDLREPLEIRADHRPRTGLPARRWYSPGTLRRLATTPKAFCQRRQAVVRSQPKRAATAFQPRPSARIHTRSRYSSSNQPTQRVVSSIRSMAAGSGGKRKRLGSSSA